MLAYIPYMDPMGDGMIIPSGNLTMDNLQTNLEMLLLQQARWTRGVPACQISIEAGRWSTQPTIDIYSFLV